MAEDHDLFEPLDAAGMWWIADQPGVKVPGTFHYTPTDSPRLELEGNLPGMEEAMDGPQEHFTMLGETGVGRFRLEGCLVSNHNRTNRQEADGWVDHHKWTIVISQVFFGDFLDKDEPPRFHQCSVRISMLEEWLNLRPWESRFVDDGGIRHQFDLKRLEATEVRVNEIDANVRMAVVTSGPVHPGRTQLMVSFRQFITISPDEPQPWNYYANLIHQLNALLVIMTGKTCFPESIRVPAAYDEEQRLIQGEVTVLQRPGLSEPPPTASNFNMPYSPGWNHLGPPADELLQAWLSLYSKAPEVPGLLASTLSNHQLFLNVEFMFLVNALESWHRQMMGGSYLTKDDYKLIGDALIAAIPRDVQQDHRAALKSRIGFGYEFSLARRLKELWDLFPAGILEPLRIDEPTDWLRRLKDTRNYYSHYDPGIEHMSPQEQLHALPRLRSLILALLCRELGFDDLAILGVMRRSMAGYY